MTVVSFDRGVGVKGGEKKGGWGRWDNEPCSPEPLRQTDQRTRVGKREMSVGVSEIQRR